MSKNRQNCRKTSKKTSKSRKKGKNRKIYQNLSKLLKKQGKPFKDVEKAGKKRQKY